MKTLKKIQALVKIDMSNVWQDDFLSWVIAMPVGIALLVRWGLPLILQAIGDYFKQNYLIHYPVLAGFLILLITPMVAGMIVGFLLLDQRDDRTLIVLQVTPVAPLAYLGYSLVMPVLSSMLITTFSFYLAGLGEVGVVPILLAVLSATLLSPLVALSMVCFAENKVQGFALVKASIVLWIPLLITYFAQPKWQHLCGIIPLYWPCRIYWALLSDDPLSWLYFFIGLAYNLILVLLLLFRFKNNVFFKH